MTTSLMRGANASTNRPDGTSVAALLLGISWTNPDADVNLFAILCGGDRKVRGEGDFLYWDQPVSSGDEVFLLDANMGRGPGPDDAQVVIDLEALPLGVERIVVALACVEPEVTLRVLGSLRSRVLDAHGGDDLWCYENRDGYTVESCAVLWEVYRRYDEWKIRAVDQGWEGGLEDLAKAYGVDVSS